MNGEIVARLVQELREARELAHGYRLTARAAVHELYDLQRENNRLRERYVALLEQRRGRREAA